MTDSEAALAHYGILRRSGRYPWGTSGWGDGGSDTVYERANSFANWDRDLKKQGWSDVDIAKAAGMSTTELRDVRSYSTAELKQQRYSEAVKLRDKGMSYGAIAKQMGLKNESTVRSILSAAIAKTAEFFSYWRDAFKKRIEETDGYLDVGDGMEATLGMSKDRLRTIVSSMRDEGYEYHVIRIPQLGNPGNYTTAKVLAKPGVTVGEILKNKDKIVNLQEYSTDGGYTHHKIKPPLNFSSKRLQVVYAEDGGTDADGVMYIRRGVKDLSLDGAAYAQVRVQVDGSHYLKGMAVYSDDLPKGVDIQFHTNKSSTGNKLDALKAIKDDNRNDVTPFGTTIARQVQDEKGNVTSVMNLVNWEGRWNDWNSSTISSQVLSKQRDSLAKAQLQKLRDDQRKELDEILALTNPVLRETMLQSFSETADKYAETLEARALSGQRTQVILPIKSMSNKEIYAPNFQNGEDVVLIRFPHGGIFEIPELKVNNRNPEAKKLLGTSPKDAVGISPEIAQRLSGADFDGDTVLVIPNPGKKVFTTKDPESHPALKRLQSFDAKVQYAIQDPERKKVQETFRTQLEMGKISNLITDMTLLGAPIEDIVPAVRHSQTVIDAEKHGLDASLSKQDNGISRLTAKYRNGDATAGASTIVSRASSEKDVPKFRAARIDEAPGGPINPETGEKQFVPTGEMKRIKDPSTGEWVISDKPKTAKASKMFLVKDAYDLVGDPNSPKERIYADHANAMKALANEARKAMVAIKPTPINKEAYPRYSEERASLDALIKEGAKENPKNV